MKSKLMCSEVNKIEHENEKTEGSTRKENKA